MLRWVIRQREATVIAITILTIIYFALRSSALFTVDNIIATMQYVAPFIVIGAGEVLMLVLAEIDLSAGQVYLTAGRGSSSGSGAGASLLAGRSSSPWC